MDALAQTLVSGALLGCLFGCIALGITVKWGLLGVADFFHISLVLVSAYISYTLVVEAQMSPFASLAITVPAFFLVGVGLQYLLHVIKASVFTTLLISFGLFIAAENTISLIWSSDVLSMRTALPEEWRTAVALGDLAVHPVDLLSLGAAVILVGGAAAWLRYTRSGRALRAMHQDLPIAQIFGVRTLTLALVVSGVVAATAAVAGTIVAMKMPLQPHLTTQWLGIVFVACLLGGLGRPLSALLVAVLVLMIQNVWSLYLSPSWSPAIAYGVLFLYLALEPVVRAGRLRIAMGRTA